MDPEKTREVNKWPTPESHKELQSFSGFANFIHNYSSVAAPLSALTSSTATFVWTTRAEAVFLHLKRRFSSVPVLTLALENN